MSVTKDLTRWNRAGRLQFDYIDGNAATYLEKLRRALLYHFIDVQKLVEDATPLKSLRDLHSMTWWQKSTNEQQLEAKSKNIERAEMQKFKKAVRWDRLWLDFPEERKTPNSTNQEPIETPTQALNKILDQYNQVDRSDWGWEINRAFARMTHILTKHINAYANEGYIETATQWKNLRRLVEMLDYHPAPPSSASTVLVIEAKKDKHGILKTGYRIQYRPKDGDPVVYETLKNIEIDDALNELRFARWDIDPNEFNPFSPDDPINKPSPDLDPNEPTPISKWLNWQPTQKVKLSNGDVALFSQYNPHKNTELACATLVAEINDLEDGVIRFIDPKISSWIRGHTKLAVEPKRVIKPYLNGSDIVHLDRTDKIDVGDVLLSEESGNIAVSVVVEKEGERVRFAEHLPTENTPLFKLRPIPLTEDEYRFPIDQVRRIVAKTVTTSWIDPEVGKLVSKGIDDESVDSYMTFEKAIADNLLEVYAQFIGDEHITTVSSVGEAALSYKIDGSPEGLQSGDWIIGEGVKDENGDRVLYAMKVKSIETREDCFIMTFENVTSTIPGYHKKQNLYKALKDLQPALDEDAFETITLSELVSGNAGKRSALAIQDLGPIYMEKLGDHFDRPEAQDVTIQDTASLTDEELVEIDTTKSGKATVFITEIHTKAKRIKDFDFDISGLENYASMSLKRVVESIASAKDAAQFDLKVIPFGIRRFFVDFQHVLRPAGYNRHLYGQERSIPDNNLHIISPLDKPFFERLTKGKQLVIEREENGQFLDPKIITISSTDRAKNEVILTEPLRLLPIFRKGNTVIRGNVVLAGHGETKGKIILGSGNAAVPNQSFLIERNNISFVADPTQPSGVKADIRLVVDDQTWQQVGSFRDSRATDPHYTVRMTEEEYLKIEFGDGFNGRRLPTGTNNVRVAHSLGNGIRGNVPANSLINPVKPDPLINQIRQPLSAAGGNDMEGTESLRDNAPRSMLTLERAVSLDDFADLAMSQSNVWQALALPKPGSGGYHKSIEIVIVPAGGVTISKNKTNGLSRILAQDLKQFIESHAIPGITVDITPYHPVILNLNIRLRIKQKEYDPETIEAQVRQVVTDSLALERRVLGQSLHVSEIYKMVEAVKGVENSVCAINGVSFPETHVVQAQYLPAKEREVVYLDESMPVDIRSLVNVDTEEYTV